MLWTPSTSRGATDTYHFRLGRRAYERTGALGWLLFNAFLICAFICASLSAWLLPTYSHAFTPYLKWQDALVALCWYMAFISLGGCVLVGRFLYALHAGYRKAMLTLVDHDTLIVRDLSHENLASIFWIAGTAFTCFLAALLGLVPLMLIGWTLYLPHPILAVPVSAVMVVLSVAGLMVTVFVTFCIIMGCIGCISFCRKMAALQAYPLTSQTTLTITPHDKSGSYVLTILSPDKPESMINLALLDVDDQRHLLHLLQKRWIDAADTWNPHLSWEIEAALKKRTA